MKEQDLKDEFTFDVKEVWATTYNTLSSVMIDDSGYELKSIKFSLNFSKLNS